MNLHIAVIGPLGLPARSGGVTRHSEELYAALVERGHRVTLYGRRSHGSPARWRGIDVVSVPAPKVAGLETFTYGIAAAVLARRLKPDVIHFQGVAGASGVGLCGEIPLVSTIHSEDFTFEKWPAPVRAQLRRQERQLVSRSREVIAVSDALASSIHSRYPTMPKPTVIGNFLPDLPEPDPSLIAGLGLPRRYVLTVGRLVPEKGIETAVAAAAKAGLAHVVVGAGRYGDSYEAQLRSSAPVTTVFTGELDSGELAALYAGADAYLSASRREGFGLTLLEAMSCGLPVVASDIDAHREVLAGCGELFAPGDVSAAAAALSKVVSDHSVADAHRVAGLARAAEFAKGPAIDRIEQILLAAATA